MLAAAPVYGAEIMSITVERNDGRIYVDADMFIAAPRSHVFAALADYDHFRELSSRYIASRYVEPAEDGTPRIYTEVKGCVLFFCRTIKRYALLQLSPDTNMVALVETELSDLEYGREEWQLQSVSAGTRVLYTHEMDPEFWVPPLIGVWAIRRILTSDALSAAERIEKMALSKPTTRPAAAEPKND